MDRPTLGTGHMGLRVRYTLRYDRPERPDAAGERGDEMFLTMARRHGAQILDLDTEEFLGI